MSQLNASFNTMCPLCVCAGIRGESYPVLGCFACGGTGTIPVAYAPAELAATYSDLPLSTYEAFVQQNGNTSETLMIMAMYRTTRTVRKSTSSYDPVKDNLWCSGRIITPQQKADHVQDRSDDEEPANQ